MSTPTKSQGLHAMNHGVATPPSSEQTILVPFVDFDQDVFSKFVSILGVTAYPQSVNHENQPTKLVGFNAVHHG